MEGAGDEVTSRLRLRTMQFAICNVTLLTAPIAGTILSGPTGREEAAPSTIFEEEGAEVLIILP